MFKLAEDGTTLMLHRGNTGTLRIKLKGYSFGSNDRAYWAMVAQNGTPIRDKICEIVDGYIEIPFENTDTDYLSPGTYYYAVTAATDPVYENGKIVNGSGVSTPHDDMAIIISDTAALV